MPVLLCEDPLYYWTVVVIAWILFMSFERVQHRSCKGLLESMSMRAHCIFSSTA